MQQERHPLRFNIVIGKEKEGRNLDLTDWFSGHINQCRHCTGVMTLVIDPEDKLNLFCKPVQEHIASEVRSAIDAAFREMYGYNRPKTVGFSTRTRARKPGS